MNEISTEHLKNISFYIFSLYLVIDSVNIFYNYKLYRKDHIFGYIFSKDNNLISEYLKKKTFLRRILAIPFIYIITARLLILAAVLLGYRLVFILFLIQLIVFYRNYLYMDASEKLALTVLLGFSVYDMFEIPAVKELGLIFICTSVLIVYFSTAYHKMRSSLWRSGKVMSVVLASQSAGSPGLAAFFHQNPVISRLICWGIIILQLTFFLSIIQYTILCIYLSMGFLFHIANMYFLKLYSFFIIFVSAYPLIYYVCLKINGLLFH